MHASISSGNLLPRLNSNVIIHSRFIHLKKQCQKIHSIKQSYLFAHILKCIGTYTVTIILRSLVTSVAPHLINKFSLFTIINTIALGVLLGETIRFRKQIAFESSILYIILNDNNWWNTITDNIVLGALPLKMDLEALKTQHNIHAVLTMIESFELEPGLVNPISTSDWNSHQIIHKHIQAQDLMSISTDKIEEGVEFLHRQVRMNKRTYVHCKAGRGRSAMIVMAYLLRYGSSNQTFTKIQDVNAFVKSKRPQVYLTKWQQQAVEHWFKNTSKSSVHYA